VSKNDTQPAKKDLIRATYQMAWFGVGLAGCVTVFIIGAAILTGFWLDKTFESTKHLFTFGLVLLSVPLTIVAMWWVARFTAKRFKPSGNGSAQEENSQEDADSVGT
jgi:tetrahydromethanopterin S-methyltransferase subunit E